MDLNKYTQLRKIFGNTKGKDIYDLFIEYGNHATDVEQRQQSFCFIWKYNENLLLDMSSLVQLGLKLIQNFDHRNIRDLIAPCVTESPNLYSREDINLLFDLSKDEQSDRYKYSIAKSILEFFMMNNYKNYYHSWNNLMIIVNKAIYMLFNLLQYGNDIELQFSAVKLLLDTAKEFNEEMSQKLLQDVSLVAKNLIKKFTNFFMDPSQQSCIEQSKKIFNDRYVDIGIASSLLECYGLYKNISPQLLLSLCKNVKNEYCKYYLANNLLYYIRRCINDDHQIDTGFYFQSAVNILLELARNANNLDCKYEAFKQLKDLTNQLNDVEFPNKLIQEVYEIALSLKDEALNRYQIQEVDRMINHAKDRWFESYSTLIPEEVNHQ